MKSYKIKILQTGNQYSVYNVFNTKSLVLHQEPSKQMKRPDKQDNQLRDVANIFSLMISANGTHIHSFIMSIVNNKFLNNTNK